MKKASTRSSQLHFKKVIRASSQNQAREEVSKNSSTIAVVYRDKPRTVLFKCPCGCHQILVINVDVKAGKAWKLQDKNKKITLTPSVCRTTGCKSHFFVWQSQVLWCGHWQESDDDWFEHIELEDLPRNWWERFTKQKKTKKK